MFLLVRLWLLWSLVEVHSQTVSFPYVSFGVNNLSNNSYVDLSLVGKLNDGSDSVSCHTDLMTCCSSSDGIHHGEWFFPNETGLRFCLSGDSVYKVHGNQRLDLRRKNNVTSSSGIYRCDIATVALHDDNDLSVREAVYVGLYPPSAGDYTLNH